MIFGTLITISSNSWLGAWIGLEINLLSFIPLIRDSNLISTEASLKYFLTQALASALLLFRIVLFYLNKNIEIREFNQPFISIIILSALLLKTGAAPFHFWFPNIIEGLSWNNALILITWQKLAPLVLISYSLNNSLLTISIIISVIIGSIGGLNQTSLRKLIAFSSINNLGWIISAILINEKIWILYFLIYSILTINITYFFNLLKISHIIQLFSMFFQSKLIKFFVFINLLSLGGLPPFLGFLPKWIVIQSNVINSHYFMIVILTVITLITLYFYLRICYSAFIINHIENSWINSINFNSFSKITYLFSSSISIFGIIFISLII